MINLLRLYDPILQKVRIGNFWDGGYVVASQSLCRSSALFSYGVGNDISFEKSYVDATGRMAYCFDHSIEGVAIEDNYKANLIYTKEGLSGVKAENMNNFLEHYKERNASDRVLFKCDIEGAEYEFILNTDIAEMSKITTGLIFEFHHLSDPVSREKFFQSMAKLNEHYLLCHVHGNNYANNFVYEEALPNNYIKLYSIPNVIEFTFINKDLVPYTKVDNKVYPCSYLDRKNDLSRNELDLSFINLL
jgi:hypothetical protein